MPLSGVDIHFECVRCSKCCRGSRLPLTVAEAVTWLEDGHEVQVLCEATPWIDEPSLDDAQAQHRRRRSFAGVSGSLPIRVAVILAANFSGPCPNLGPNEVCRIHARRPSVCRIYPAEVNPFIALAPGNKACPAEAWAKHLPVLQRAGQLVDQHLIDDIRRLREADAAHVGFKQRLCSRLQISDAGIANEGLCVNSVDRATLLTELALAAAQIPEDLPPTDWRFVSNRAKSVTALSMVGARSGLAQNVGRPAFEYLSFRASKD
jgi:Fe-S-cluster containining protein